MNDVTNNIKRVVLKLIFFIMPSVLQSQVPMSGDIYREYSCTMGHSNEDWRVTDPNALDIRAHKFVPNPILEININDLKDAIKAEVLLDRWGGHAGTSNKKIRFNGFEWISLPELTTTPSGNEPEAYHYQDNPVVSIPLEQLKEGVNTFEGTCSDANIKWPQWGWDGIIIRIYYNTSKKHPEGKITSHTSNTTFGENPVFSAEAESEVGIERIDFLAYYDGYDENGDGIFKDWHHHYWCLRGDKLIDINGHIGTAWHYPYKVEWNTNLIPDQEVDSVKLVARIKDNNGIWYVTEIVDGLSLERNGNSVKMYTASDIPLSFNVRNYQSKSCNIRISPEADLLKATEAWFFIRTWNGYAPNHEPFIINSWPNVFQGHDHNFDFDIIPVPVMVLRQGDNQVSFYSKTIHHGAEVLWPGPALIVRYQKQ